MALVPFVEEQDDGRTLVPYVETKQNKGILGDIGTGLKRGVQQMPGMVTGLADIAAAPVSAATGINRPFSRGADWLGEQTGFQPGKWAEQAGAEYSPEMQQSLKNVEEAKGFFPKIGAIAQNPRVAANLVAESLASTIAGGVLARGAMGAVAGAEKLAAMKAAGDTAGLLKAGAIAGGIGEGVVTAGQQMAQTDYGVDPLRAAGTALGAGAVTGAIGAGSGRLANSAIGKKLGLSDIETSIAAGTLGQNAGKAGALGYAKRVGAGALQEGLLEEAPQSYSEQVWQNLANGKPWNEGAAEAAAQGAVAGGLMGGGINAIPRFNKKPEEQAQVPQNEVPQAQPAVVQPVNPNVVEVPTQTGETVPVDKTSGPISAAVHAGTQSGAVPTAQPVVATTADPFERLATLELLAEQRPLTPQENAEADALSAQLANEVTDDGNSTPDGAIPERASAIQMDAPNRQDEAPNRQDASKVDPKIVEQRAQNYYEAGNAAIDSGNKEEGLRLMAKGDEILRSLNQNQAPAQASGIERMLQNVPSKKLEEIASNENADVRVRAAATNILNLQATAPAQPTTTSPLVQKATQFNVPVMQAANVASQDTNTPVAATNIPANPVANVQGSNVAPQQQGVQVSTNQQAKADTLGSAVQAKAGANNFMDLLMSTEVDVGGGFKTNNAAIATIRKAAEGFAPSEKAKITRLINANTAKQKNGDVLLKPYFYDAVSDHFTWTRDYLINALNDAPKQEVGKQQPEGGKQGGKPQRKAGPQNRDDLVGAILRVTGGNGIASNMAQTITGDKAGSGNAKLRGLFTNSGTMDLGDVAELLRVEESFDVRDGDHLSELIRNAAAGDTAVSMSRMEEDAAAKAEAVRKDYYVRRAEELGLKKVGGKRTLDMVIADVEREEARLNELEANAEREAIQDADAIESATEGGMTDADFMRWLSDDIASTYTPEEIQRAEQDQADKEDARIEAVAIADSEERAQSEVGQGNGNRPATPQGGGTEAGARPAEGFNLAAQTPAELAAIAAKQKAADNLARKEQLAAIRAERAAKNKAEKKRRAAQIVREREAAHKAKIDAAVASFDLGQQAPEAVDRRVNTEQARGQQDVFAQKPVVAPQNQGRMTLMKDGIDGKEIAYDAVPNGNSAFQYALGKTQEDGEIAVFRRRSDERGWYGGWRLEANQQVSPASVLEQQAKAKQGDMLASTEQKPAQESAQQSQKDATKIPAKSFRDAERIAKEMGDGWASKNIERVDDEGYTVGEWFAVKRQPESNGKPDPGRYVQPKINSDRAGQMALADRAGRIASLKQVNDFVTKRNPSAAYSDSEIDNAASDKIDAMMDWLIASQKEETKPSSDAKKSFDFMLKHKAMRTYHELVTEKLKDEYRSGYYDGYDSKQFPEGAIKSGAMDDGYLLGRRIGEQDRTGFGKDENGNRVKVTPTVSKIEESKPADRPARTDKIGSGAEKSSLEQYLAEEPHDRNALNVTITTRGKDGKELTGPRFAQIEAAVRDGMAVVLTKSGPALVDKNMRGWDKNDLGAAGMSYANWLISKRDAESKPAAVDAKKEAKEPWQMTLVEFAKSKLKPSIADQINDVSQAKSYEAQHRKEIGKALSEGKPVPAKVLADYPDLQKKEAPGESSATNFNNEDAGEELVYNRRNRLTRALKWEDVENKEAALRVKEVVKSKVSPKPDYQVMIDEGMEPLIAHMVKQAYDSLPTKPVVRDAPTDEQLKLYMDSMTHYMNGVMSWAKDADSVRSFINQIASRASRLSAMRGGAMVDLSKLAETPAGKTLLETVYPGGWKNFEAKVRIINNDKAYRALQPSTDEAIKALKDIEKGWPAAMESWQRQGYSVKPSDGLVSVKQKDYAGDGYFVVINGRTDLEHKFATKEDAEKSASEVKPFLFLDKYGRVVSQHDTEEQAIEAAREKVKREANSDQIKEEGINVAAAERTGPAYRKEGEDISTDRINETFGFRGVNFGDWMKGDSPSLNKERQLHLNFIYDSFMDLANILGVPPKAMSLNGLLGVAVGAQGRGGKSAAIAHFVPGVNEINITRKAGAGALAHEWGHALDHNYARLAGLEREKDAFLTAHTDRQKSGRVVTENGRQRMGYDQPAFAEELRPEILEKFKAVVQAMNKRMETQAEYIARMESYKSLAKSRVESWITAIRRDFEVAAKKEQGESALLVGFDILADRMRKADLGDGYVSVSRNVDISPVVAKMRSFYKSATGRIYSLENSKNLQANLDSLKHSLTATTDEAGHVPQQVTSNYAKSSATADRETKRTYWNTTLEKFARAFDAFITDEIAARAVKNTYLSGIEAVAPQGDERKAINAAIRDLVSEFKTKETDKGVALYSRGESQATPMPQSAAVKSIGRIITDKATKALIDAGLLRFVDSEAQIPGGTTNIETAGQVLGATMPDGTIYLNLGALNEGNIAGVFQHEGFHSAARGWLGAESYSALMGRLEKLRTIASSRMAQGKGLGTWYEKANAAIPQDTREQDKLEELAGYAIEMHANGDQQPSVIRKWVEDFLSAIRTAIIKHMPNGKVKLWALNNLKPQDLARMAVSGMKAKAGSMQSQGREAMAYSKTEINTPLAPNGKRSNLTPDQWEQVRTPEFKAWFGDWEKHAKAANPVGSLWSDPNVSKVVDENGEPLVVYHGSEKGGFVVMRPDMADKHRSDMLFAAKSKYTAASYSGTHNEIDLNTSLEVVEKYGSFWIARKGEIVGGNYAEQFDTRQEAQDEIDNIASEDNGAHEEQSGIYSIFLNIRNPNEQDFEGANWDGSVHEMYEVLDENGDNIYHEDGRRMMPEDEAEELAGSYDGSEVIAVEDIGLTTNSVAEEARAYGNDGAIIRNTTDGGGLGGYVGVDDVFVFFDSNQAKSATQHIGPGYTSDDLRYSRASDALLSRKTSDRFEIGESKYGSHPDHKNIVEPQVDDTIFASKRVTNFPTRIGAMFGGYGRVYKLKDGRYLLEQDRSSHISKVKPFWIIGDNLDAVLDRGAARLDRSYQSIDNARTKKIDKATRASLETEFGKVFDYDISNAARSDSFYITHKPSGTKIRISDHDLPSYYENTADIDLRHGDDIAAALRERLDESVPPPSGNSSNAGSRSLGVSETDMQAQGREVMAYSKSLPDTINVDGIDRPTTNSNGNLIHPTEEGVINFWKWFGASRVVDAEGRPLIVYHGTPNGTFDAFKPESYFSETGKIASIYTGTSASSISSSAKTATAQSVYPVYLKIERPFDTRQAKIRNEFKRDFYMQWGTGTELQNSGLPDWNDGIDLAEWINESGRKYDGLLLDEGGIPNDDGTITSRGISYVPLQGGAQVKSATGNTGAFSPTNPDIRYSRASTTQQPSNQPQPSSPWQQAKAKFASLVSPESIDTLIYNFQDKYVDLKNIIEHIKKMGGTLTDLNDARLGEETYHSKVMKKTKDFSKNEIRPLLQQLLNSGIKKEELEQYLHARHAPEANRVLAERNPNQKMIVAGQQKASADLKSLQSQLSAAQASGAATKAIEAAIEQAKAGSARWNGAQAFQGTEAERNSLSGMSDQEAAQIMASVPAGKLAAMQNAAAKVDAIQAKTLAELEKMGLMDKASLDAWRATYQHYIPLHRDEAHPDSTSHPVGQGFSVRGDASKRRVGSNEKVTNILGHIAMQREAAIVRGEKNSVEKRLYLLASQNPIKDFWRVDRPPMREDIDPRTGFVRRQVDPTYKNKPNVLMVRIAGKDAAIFFEEHNPEAVRLAGALKNLDGQDLDVVERTIGAATRWIASVNTQYNPIFGLINFARDIQSASLNLTSTELTNRKKAVWNESLRLFKEVAKSGFSLDKMNAADRALWEDFQDNGGATGYRDMFANPEDRAKALDKELNALNRGNVARRFYAVADWLSNYNEAMENVVRMAAYKVGLQNGMSKERAASLAKNLTVNFNRKGAKAQKLGAFYAFFNASVQGTARMAQTLKGPVGKKIIIGGIALGVMQQMLGMLMMGGGDDDEWDKIPDFVKERSLVFPTGKDTYVSIPLPLGFNVLPNIGRLMAEWATGGQDKPTAKQIGKLFNVMLSALNPVGGNDLVDVMSPTVSDPVVSLLRNKDWTGKPIFRDNMASLDPTPGFTRTKDTATPWARGMSYVVNMATGGTDYQPGAISWTPDQIDYVIGQLTGGAGRELGKLAQTISAPINGDELPVHKIPLVGRVAGSTAGVSGQSERFYENVRAINGIEREIKGIAKAGGDVGAYIDSEPRSSLVGLANVSESQVKKLREAQRTLKQSGEVAGARELDGIVAGLMRGLNTEARAANQR